ncbi:MAG: lipid-A-disaccharide synthase [Rickettsiales bacterium]|nr:lipid-A-disaccharide synthase [Rickettsiales bacterium]OUW04479.1 MAG: lipid-A-disaccharide synthase [Betaproteobacteria bacterium TMED156]
MKRIMFSVGEPSGELLACEIIKKIKKKSLENIIFTGMGSEKMDSLGVNLVTDSTETAVVGFTEVFKKWFILKNALKKLKNELLKNPPNILILVDYVEFNLRLGQFAKTLGIPVLFYVSPQIWAWGSDRVKRISNATDAIALIFPFEIELYKKTKIRAKYVGHPLTEILPTSLNTETSKNELSITTHDEIIGLLPGSRISELKQHLPVLKSTIIEINKTCKNVIFLLAVINNKKHHILIKNFILELQSKNINIKIFSDKTYEVISASNVVAVASGTAVLEVALLKKPMIVFYKTSLISYLILKTIITVDYISLVNILLKKGSVEEFIQHDFNYKNLSKAIIKLSKSKELQTNQIHDFETIRNILGNCSASDEVTKMIFEMTSKP